MMRTYPLFSLNQEFGVARGTGKFLSLDPLRTRVRRCNQFLGSPVQVDVSLSYLCNFIEELRKVWRFLERKEVRLGEVQLTM